MSSWRQLTRGLRALTNRTAADRDVADEVEHYLEQATEAFMADGLSADEARRAARMALGSTTAVREQMRGSGWETVVEAFVGDLRYGTRRLFSRPGFAAVSVLTLAIGIGASTAIFSAVNPILFESLPYPHAERVVMIWDSGRDGSRLEVTFGTHRELLERNRTFEAMATMKPWLPTATGTAEPERLEGQRVTSEYFRALGVSPVVGRSFLASEDRVGGPRVAILSDALWRRRFGGDTAIVGRPIKLDDASYTVVGVMPRGFENVLSPAAEIWAPLQYDAALPADGREWGHHLRMVGRLRAGVSSDHATQDLDAIARSPVPEFHRVTWASLHRGLTLNSVQEEVTRGVKPALIAVLGAVLLVLAIACVNVMNLLLARGAERRHEFALRAALGASRMRLARQLLTESLLLAAIGGALGVMLAEAGTGTLIALSPSELPRAHAVGVDGAALVFALSITTIIGLLIGLIPALYGARRDLHASARQASPHIAGTHRITRRMLVVAEVALALVLLIGAALLLRSLDRLFAIAPGFEPAHLLTMQVQASGQRLGDGPATLQFFKAALEAVRSVPGVTDAGFTSQLPLSGDFDKYGVQYESLPSLKPDEDRSVFRYAVSPGYLEAMRIPLRRGRVLDAHDSADAPIAVLVSESLARRKFGAPSPIGQRIHVGDTSRPWQTIVGVVGDVKQPSLAASQTDAVYITTDQWYSADQALWLVVRSTGDPAALASAVRQAIWSVDKDQPVVRVATMSDLLASTAAERRFALILFEAFGLVALALAAIGIYGVLAGGVTERTREIGVRHALGASRLDIVWLVIREGMTLTGIGVAIGLVGAVAASGALITLLFNVSPLDPTAYVGVIALLVTVATMACGVPAWRAALVDPAITLKSDA